ncbi:hypothetical protein BY996DRAFT_6454446 [Phakopsora pachyrhizi]|nr:hypothetical protein BY996DRAFT_6454446 [Phakopsora pachyrhizi]
MGSGEEGGFDLLTSSTQMTGFQWGLHSRITKEFLKDDWMMKIVDSTNMEHLDHNHALDLTATWEEVKVKYAATDDA